MHGTSLSGHWYPARRAAATADPDDSPVNGPFLVDDALLLFRQPNAKPRCVCLRSNTKKLSIPANKVVGSPQSLGNRNASFTPARGLTALYSIRSEMKSGTLREVGLSYRLTP